MRKVAVVFLVLTIISAFAACSKKEDVTDPSLSVATTTTAPNSVSVSADTSTTAQADQMTYVLTTAADKTVPWENTTRFEIIPVSTTQSSTQSISDIELIPGNIEAPNVNTDVVSTERTTTQPPTAPQDFTDNTIGTLPDPEATRTTTTTTTTRSTTKRATTTTRKATTTTQPTTVKKTAKGLAIESSGYNSNTDCIILDVSSEGWSSDFKGTRTNVTVVVDGQALKAPCKVPSTKNADGRYEVQIDLSDLGISSGSTVSYTIDEGVIQTKSGTQYNSSYSGSCDVG